MDVANGRDFLALFRQRWA